MLSTFLTTWSSSQGLDANSASWTDLCVFWIFSGRCKTIVVKRRIELSKILQDFIPSCSIMPLWLGKRLKTSTGKRERVNLSLEGIDTRLVQPRARLRVRRQLLLWTHQQVHHRLHSHSWKMCSPQTHLQLQAHQEGSYVDLNLFRSRIQRVKNMLKLIKDIAL